MSEQDAPIVLHLPEVLDAAQAAALLTSLLDARGKPLDIDASCVGKIGTLGLQILISARITWAADGVPLRIINPSQTFRDAQALAGANLQPERASA